MWTRVSLCESNPVFEERQQSGKLRSSQNQNFISRADSFAKEFLPIWIPVDDACRRKASKASRKLRYPGVRRVRRHKNMDAFLTARLSYTVIGLSKMNSQIRPVQQRFRTSEEELVSERICKVNKWALKLWSFLASVLGDYYCTQ